MTEAILIIVVVMLLAQGGLFWFIRSAFKELYKQVWECHVHLQNKIISEHEASDEQNSIWHSRTRDNIKAAVEELYGRINILDESFKSEAADLRAHTESLKAHGKALQDAAHVAEVAPRRVVSR